MKYLTLNLIFISITTLLTNLLFPNKVTGFEDKCDPVNKFKNFEQTYFKALSSSPKIIYIYNFLSEEECDYLISIAEPRLEKSTVLDYDSKNRIIDSGRISEGFFLTDYREDTMVKRIEERIALLTGIPIKNAEPLHVLKYKEGGEYKPHYDYFSLETIGGSAAYERGGQRIATLIMYLKTPEEGGKTIFPLLNIEAKPIKRNAVLFYNCSSEENVDPLTLHGGAPVISGEKWIVTKWLHSRQYH